MSQIVNIHTHRIQETQALQLLSIDYQLFSSDMRTSALNNNRTTLAIHPMDYGSLSEISIAEFETALVSSNAVAIGEVGFDKHSKLSNTDQITLFQQIVEVSTKTRLPIIIHCIGRWNELQKELIRKPKDSPKWIIHGFRKTNVGLRLLELGAHFSLGEALMYDEKLQEFAKNTPISALFLETDDAEIEISQLYEKLAEIKCLSLPSIIDQLYSNYLAVFHHE